MIELVDLAPTLLDAAGLEVPGRMQGKSLLPMLKGEDELVFVHEQVLPNTNNAWTHGEMTPMGRCWRTNREKIVVITEPIRGNSMTWKTIRRSFSTFGTIGCSGQKIRNAHTLF